VLDDNDGRVQSPEDSGVVVVVPIGLNGGPNSTGQLKRTSRPDRSTSSTRRKRSRLSPPSSTSSTSSTKSMFHDLAMTARLWEYRA
jgi:hypothetical protein